MAFVGKEYKFEKQENFEEFINSLGAATPEGHKKVLLSHKPTVKLVKNGDTYTFYTSKPDNTFTELTFKSGVEFDELVQNNTAKTTVTVDGNSFTQIQKFPNQNIVLTYKREFTSDGLVLTITNSAWDGVAKRYYKV